MPGETLSVCPLDHRYGRKVMKDVFSEESRFQMYLDVEAALARAHARLGNISEKEAATITEKAKVGTVSIDRIKEIEEETNHDIMAMVKALAEQCGGAGGKVHLGATSNDIVDTSTALQIKASLEIIEGDLKAMQEALCGQAGRHRDTVMLGRTHGQAAVPITFGLKMAVFAMEFHRHLWRLREARQRVCAGKLMGAVGTGAALGPNAIELQDLVMGDLGLAAEEAPTQLVGRDRYAEYLFLLGNIASSIERLATEIRNLQRTEIGEVAEAFDAEKQVGSSTMAHKRNPITSENVCGLARIVRSNVYPGLENMVLWHERDLTNSSCERFTISHSTVLTDDILVKMAEVVRNLHVDPDAMKRNIEATGGAIMGESVMMALVAKGVGRQEAHELVRKASMDAIARKVALKEALLDAGISEKMDDGELDEALDPEAYTGHAGTIVDSVVKKIKEMD